MDTSGATEPVFDFYPRPPRGGRPATHGGQTGGSTFLSTPSARRATRAQCTVIRKKRFLSTPSARRATPPWVAAPRRALFLSTPSARRATKAIDDYTMQLIISIHALREEGDALGDLPKNALVNFYPRPPRGGRRAGIPPSMRVSEFLSTPSARRATSRTSRRCSATVYFYPRPPRGGRHIHKGHPRRSLAISIHALREEGDALSAVIPYRPVNFYPRPPRGGRHLRVLTPSNFKDFYPRPPRGGRRPSRTCCSCSANFYPRPPRGGRPAVDARSVHPAGISIHALREEGDHPEPCPKP